MTGWIFPPSFQACYASATRLPPVIHGCRGTSRCEAPIDSLGEGETTLDWACPPQ